MAEPMRLAKFTPAQSPPTLGYSQAAALDGRIAFISGQVGVDRQWRLATGLRAQTRLALANLRVAVEACGASLDDVAKLTVYAVADADLSIYAEERDLCFRGIAAMPASTFVRVAGLYEPAALIEIEAVVCLPPLAVA